MSEEEERGSHDVLPYQQRMVGHREQQDRATHGIRIVQSRYILSGLRDYFDNTSQHDDKQQLEANLDGARSAHYEAIALRKAIDKRRPELESQLEHAQNLAEQEFDQGAASRIRAFRQKLWVILSASRDYADQDEHALFARAFAGETGFQSQQYASGYLRLSSETLNEMRQLMDDENRAAFSIEDVMGRCRQLVDAKYEVQQEVQKARQDTESLRSINDEVRTEIKRLEDAAGKHESELQARQNSLGDANGRIQTLVDDNTAKAGEIASLQEAALAAQEEARNELEEQERRSKRDLEDKEAELERNYKVLLEEKVRFYNDQIGTAQRETKDLTDRLGSSGSLDKEDYQRLLAELHVLRAARTTFDEDRREDAMMRRPNQAAREHAEASARSRKAQRDHALSALKNMTDERDKVKEDNDTAERAYSQHLMQELTTQNNLRVHAEAWENAWTKSSKELETERQKTAELRLECDEGIAAAVTLRLKADGHAAEVHRLNQLIEGLRKQRDQGPLQSSHVQNQDHDALKEELAAAKRATKAAHDLIEKEYIPRKTHETVKGELGSKQEELRRSNKHGKAIIEAIFPPAEISICNHPNFRDSSQKVSGITLYEHLAADWHAIKAQDHQAPTHDLLQAASLSSSLSLEWDICIADGRDLAAYAAGNITMQIRTLWFQICKGAGPFLLLEHIELVLFQSEMSARPTSMDVFVLHQATLRYHDTLPDQLDAAVEPLERVYLCLVGLRLIELVLRLQVRVFQTPDSLEQDCPLDLRPLYARVASFVNEVDFGTDKATFVRCLNFWLSCALGVSPAGSQWRGWVRVIRGFGIPTLGTHDRAIARDPYLVLRVDGSRLTFHLPTAEQVSWEFKADEYVLRFTETRRAVGEDSQLSVPVTLLAIPGSHRRWVDEYLPEIRV